MRRLLLAAAFAVVFHGWLLSSQSTWLLPRQQALPLRRAVTISLTAAPEPERTTPDKGVRPESLPDERTKAPPPAPEKPTTEAPPASEPEPNRADKTAEPVLPSPKAEGEPTPDPASRLPQFSSLFDSLETPRQTPLIPEGIAALSSTNETAPGDPETARGPEVSSKKNTVAEFEARPLYRENPPPDYPRIARHRGYQGTVILEVLVDENGAVRKVKTARTSGHKVLDRAAEAAVESWRFAPGRRGDDPIQMWVKVPVRFELE